MPTPIDDVNRPDLTPIIKASETVMRLLKRGDIVIYESTVFLTVQKRSVFQFSKVNPALFLTKIFSVAIVLKESIRAIK